MANEFISTVDASFGLGIAPLTDAEIFANAVPEPSTAALLVMGGVLGLAVGRRKQV